MERMQIDESDEGLLARTPSDAQAFAEFYRRWERPVAGFFVRAVGTGDVAADLTAEAFAEALSSAGRFDPARGEAAGWLFGIARHLLARSRERGRVEKQARVLDEQGYDEIAAELECSESVVRKRVSRGLAALRTRLGATR